MGRGATGETAVHMVDGLLDTSIIVDIIRGYPPAVAWSFGIHQEIGVTKFVWMEVIQGATSRKNQQNAVALLNQFPVVPVALADVDWALENLTRLVLAYSGITMQDALIAATSHRLSLPLYTRNLKHMRPLLGDLALEPYS